VRFPTKCTAKAAQQKIARRALFVGTHREGFAMCPNRPTTKNLQIQLKIVVRQN
jgi:hypothetical protein